MRRMLLSNNNTANNGAPPPSVLHVMVTSYQVTNWNVIERRIARYPEEARYIDEFGNTILYNALCRRIGSYPPSTAIRRLVRAYPEAVWSGIDDDDDDDERNEGQYSNNNNNNNKSPLYVACQRRANYETLRILMDERPSVKQDVMALYAFWKSYCELFGGNDQLVQFCREAQDLEASRFIVRVYHLLSYCTSKEYTLKPIISSAGLLVHTTASCSCDISLLRCMLDSFPEQSRQIIDDNNRGELPVHALARARGHEQQQQWKDRNDRLQVLLESYPDAIRIRNSNGDLPIHIAIKAGWNNIDVFINSFPESVSEVDGSGSMFPFQMAACYSQSPNALDLIYKLLRQDPRIINHHRLPCPIVEVEPSAPVNKRSTTSSSSKKVSNKYGADELSSELRQAVERIGALRDERVWKAFRTMLFSTTGIDDETHHSRWYASHAASSLPLCPVGLMQVLLTFRPEEIMLESDGDGWSALHHAASSGKKELQLLVEQGEIYGEYDDEDDDDDELPCIGRLRVLLDNNPTLARKSDNKRRLPLHIAALCGLPRDGLTMIYEAWPNALLCRDAEAFLFPAFLAAQSPYASLDSVYHLIHANPQVLKSCHDGGSKIII